jgi:hypothetical protein
VISPYCTVETHKPVLMQGNDRGADFFVATSMVKILRSSISMYRTSISRERGSLSTVENLEVSSRHCGEVRHHARAFRTSLASAPKIAELREEREALSGFGLLYSTVQYSIDCRLIGSTEI